jgi:hypothetical protein
LLLILAALCLAGFFVSRSMGKKSAQPKRRV